VDPGSAGGAGDSVVVVDPHQRDHVLDVGRALDPPRRRALPVGEDRVMSDPALSVQPRPGLLREEEVGRVVSMQVADLAPATLNANSPRRPGPASTPGQDVTSSIIRLLAVAVVVISISSSFGNERPNYKLKLT
jgi:hypothetical protein